MASRSAARISAKSVARQVGVSNALHACQLKARPKMRHPVARQVGSAEHLESKRALLAWKGPGFAGGDLGPLHSLPAEQFQYRIRTLIFRYRGDLLGHQLTLLLPRLVVTSIVTAVPVSDLSSLQPTCRCRSVLDLRQPCRNFSEQPPDE